MRNEPAATNDRPCKLVKPKKAALAAAGLLVSYTLATNASLGLVATRRADALRKRYGSVAADPKFAKLGNLSDIEAETVHSQPARGLY